MHWSEDLNRLIVLGLLVLAGLNTAGIALGYVLGRPVPEQAWAMESGLTMGLFAVLRSHHGPAPKEGGPADG